MGSNSLFGKLRKILEKPQVPAHLRDQGYGDVPWHRRFLDSIRPPSAVPGTRASMNQTQRRMLLITLGILLPVVAIWAVIDYVAGAPQRARTAFQDGMRAIGANDFAGAVTKLSASIAIAESADAYLERGNAYQNLQQPDKALADWGRAIQLDSGLAAAYTARATHFRLAGDYAKALPDLDQSIRLDPTVDAYFQRGQVYVQLGEFKRAIEDYDRSILERREAPYVYLARSIAKRALGDEEGYRQDQQRAADLGGNR
ncbi:MAG: tetratricopeptide repeat protein [Bryobacteraceae bacterium]